MTVKELRKLLINQNDNDLIVLSKDSEGNSFSPLSEHFCLCSYESTSTSSGEIWLRELTDELKKQGYSKEDLCDTGINALILYPLV